MRRVAALLPHWQEVTPIPTTLVGGIGFYHFRVFGGKYESD